MLELRKPEESEQARMDLNLSTRNTEPRSNWAGHSHIVKYMWNIWTDGNEELESENLIVWRPTHRDMRMEYFRFKTLSARLGCWNRMYLVELDFQCR